MFPASLLSSESCSVSLEEGAPDLLSSDILTGDPMVSLCAEVLSKISITQECIIDPPTEKEEEWPMWIDEQLLGIHTAEIFYTEELKEIAQEALENEPVNLQISQPADDRESYRTEN
ncbi:uncharacterized protein LOC129717636 [Wyeomyia smithii]|uniref:uncharacterized protein LOC129717636 n=1 Tax=Wyeomyia smithii TaxID=174621 RepID=UPI002467C577|nr:uncharacterized protein LOC129717636 [Wyeomyia smithii]